MPLQPLSLYSDEINVSTQSSEEICLKKTCELLERFGRSEEVTHDNKEGQKNQIEHDYEGGLFQSDSEIK